MARGGGIIGDAVGRLWGRGTVGIISVILAVLACYGVLALTALLPLIGIRLVIDEGAWAGVIAALAVVTVLAVLPGFRCHRNAAPGVAAVVGGGLILHALLVDYRALAELAGFVLLAGAVFTDAFLRRRAAAVAGMPTGRGPRPLNDGP